jgi:hypothetical protein
MKPSFEEHRVDQALEKIEDALKSPSGGYGAPSWAEGHGKDLVEALEQLQERMRARHMSLHEGALPVAIYAARELRKYLSGAQCDIANKDAVAVFYRALVNLMEELRALDQKLAREEAA